MPVRPPSAHDWPPLSARPARLPATSTSCAASGNRRSGWSTRGIAVVDATTGIIHSVNPAFAAMHGGVVGDFVGQPGSFVLAPDWRDKVARAHRATQSRGAALGCTNDHVRLTAACSPSRPRSSPPSTATGGRCYRMSWCEDLTERRAAEAAHHATGAMFEAAFAHAPNGVAMIGLDGRFLRVNEALCTMLGRRETELVGHQTIEVCHPDDLAATGGAYEAMHGASSDGVDREALPAARRRGRVGLLPRHRRRRRATTQPSYIVTHFVDFTARKLAERREAEADLRFERAFSDAPIGMALVDLDGALPQGQPLAAGDHGLFRAGAPGAHPPGDHAPRGPRQRPRGGRRRCSPGGPSATRCEQVYFAARGQLIWTKVARSLVRDSDGKPVHFIVHVEDISVRKRMEASLQRLADHDSLTDLWNRRRFEEELQAPGGALPALRGGGRAAAHGPRRLQGRQRLVRPQGGRRPAQAGGRGAAAAHSRDRCGGAAGRRRVRGPARQGLTRPGRRGGRAAACARRRRDASSSPTDGCP